MAKVYKQPRMVVIVWADSKSIEDLTGLVDDEILPLLRPAIVKSVGWLVAENDEGYLIAEEIHSDMEDPPQARDMTFILKANVKEVHKRSVKKVTAGSNDSPVRGDTKESGRDVRDVSPKANG